MKELAEKMCKNDFLRLLSGGELSMLMDYGSICKS